MGLLRTETGLQNCITRPEINVQYGPRKQMHCYVLYPLLCCLMQTFHLHIYMRIILRSIVQKQDAMLNGCRSYGAVSLRLQWTSVLGKGRQFRSRMRKYGGFRFSSGDYEEYRLLGDVMCLTGDTLRLRYRVQLVNAV
jgi:hypothetical protein